MISVDMRSYNYFTYGDCDEYGQQKISSTPKGTIKIAIYMTSANIQDNINFADCNYIGLTKAELDDSYVIEYGAEMLKVQYIQPHNRLNQVFLKKI